MHIHLQNRSYGFTLPELLGVLVIAIGILHVAIPNLAFLINSIQLGSTTREFLNHYTLAKTTAMQRNTHIHLCVSDELECIENDQWSSGWILFEDHNKNSQAEVDEIIRVSAALPNGYTLSPNISTKHLVFTPDGRVLKANGSLPLMTFRMCSASAKPENMNQYAREMVINGAGRIRLQNGRNHITDCELKS